MKPPVCSATNTRQQDGAARLLQLCSHWVLICILFEHIHCAHFKTPHLRIKRTKFFAVCHNFFQAKHSLKEVQGKTLNHHQEEGRELLCFSYPKYLCVSEDQGGEEAGGSVPPLPSTSHSLSLAHYWLLQPEAACFQIIPENRTREAKGSFPATRNLRTPHSSPSVSGIISPC